MEMTRRQRSPPSRSRRACRVPVDPEELVALAQVAAWRDAWRSGASFVTLELVSQNVQRPLDWVRRHWDDNPRDAIAGDIPLYAEPPDERKCSMALSDCCDPPPYT